MGSASPDMVPEVVEALSRRGHEIVHREGHVIQVRHGNTGELWVISAISLDALRRGE